MSEVTWEFVRRTLERLRIVSTKIDARILAEELVRRGCTSLPPYEYLLDVHDYLREISDPYAHPHGACDHCGGKIHCDSNAARFCSNRCRQRAYRLRLKQWGDRAKCNGRPNGDASSSGMARPNVTQTANSMAVDTGGRSP
jgi:hypothetical protein